MKRRSSQRWSVGARGAIVALSGTLGLGALLLGLSLWSEASETRQRADEIAALPTAHAAAIGERVLVDGLIAPATPLLRDEFVAFERVQRQGSAHKGTEDVVLERGRQPFVLETADGPVAIVNADYRFDESAPSWAAIERTEAVAGLTEGAITILGFARASPVVALGELEAAGTVSVRASEIVAGPRAAVVERLRASGDRLASAVPYFVGFGVLALLLAVWQGRKLLREP